MKRRVKSYTRRQGRHKVRVKSHLKNYSMGFFQDELERKKIEDYRKNLKEWAKDNPSMENARHAYDIALDNLGLLDHSTDSLKKRYGVFKPDKKNTLGEEI